MYILPVRQPHILDGRFYNEPDEKPHTKVLFRTGLMLAKSVIGRNLQRFLTKEDADPLAIYKPEAPELYSIEPKITWIGHATFLIQIGGVNILTDPIFGSPTPLFGRNAPPGIVPKDLPPIDVVLISHNHMDHMHAASLRQLFPELKKNNGHIFVPFGDDHWFLERSFDRVTPFHWGQRKEIGKVKKINLTFTFLPARHWSRRSLFDRNRSLWGSWMIELESFLHSANSIDPLTPHVRHSLGDGGSARRSRQAESGVSRDAATIYFAGDTAYADHFAEIRKHFPNIDTALMPIAPCEPNHIMREMHMNAEEAVHAYLDLNAQQFVPMHWHTFNFGHDNIMAPLHRLKHKWELLQLPDNQLILPNLGSGRRL